MKMPLLRSYFVNRSTARSKSMSKWRASRAMSRWVISISA
jgi:hypothetical protein